ncbi:MAG: N-acetyltransferase family protein [Pseudomonadota bacterium]
MSFTIRNATLDDIAAITAIYRDHVLTGLESFEYDPPDETEMRRRMEGIWATKCPYIVAEEEDRIAGYAYAMIFKERPAYRFGVEDSIYLAKDAMGRGMGTALLTELITLCEAAGFRQMIAIITRLDPPVSVNLHKKLGFVEQGILENVGVKNDHWLDVVYMRRSLGEGASTIPTEEI